MTAGSYCAILGCSDPVTGSITRVCPVCRQEVGHWYWCPYPYGRLRRLIFNLVRKVR